MKLAKIKEDLRNNIFAYTTRVSIELSNLCNYANIHKKCPLNLENEHIILSKKIVEKIIDSMASYDFKGTIAFHTYNEPMMDPRLFSFIHYAKQKCPECEVMIMTNGYYLNQIMADELVEVGTGSLYVTTYTPKDRQRLEKIQIDIPYIIQEFYLDDRLKLYDEELPANLNKTQCYSPLNEIIITRNGQVSLCCLDWKRKHCFGNLYNESLEDVILYSDMASAYHALSNGNRIFKICKLCGWSR
jgi:MoaA/NifB/PqqE/SkfB family radical SAM enzyme